MNRTELAKRFRKVAWGRLYWKNRNTRWRNRFDREDVCIVKNGTSTTHYHTLDTFIRDLEYAEQRAVDYAEMESQLTDSSDRGLRC